MKAETDSINSFLKMRAEGYFEFKFKKRINPKAAINITDDKNCTLIKGSSVDMGCPVR
jgi:hypothetical protein